MAPPRSFDQRSLVYTQQNQLSRYAEIRRGESLNRQKHTNSLLKSRLSLISAPFRMSLLTSSTSLLNAAPYKSRVRYDIRDTRHTRTYARCPICAMLRKEVTLRRLKDLFGMELISKREADLVNCLCVFGGGVIRLFVSPRIG